MKRRGKDCRFGVISMCIGNFIFLPYSISFAVADCVCLRRKINRSLVPECKSLYCYTFQVLVWELRQYLKGETSENLWKFKWLETLAIVCHNYAWSLEIIWSRSILNWSCENWNKYNRKEKKIMKDSCKSIKSNINTS